MCTFHKNIDLGFTNEQFTAGTHICLIYSNEEERSEIISRFIESGIKTGEKVGYFFDAPTPEHLINWLSEMGLEIDPAIAKNQLSLSSASKVYHPKGIFIPDEMLETLKSFYKEGCEENYTAVRATGEMSWALKGVEGSERLMEYESRINDLVVNYPLTAICQYDAKKFDGATILECLKVHPFMIVHGQIVHNPFYVTTSEYLKELEN